MKAVDYKHQLRDTNTERELAVRLRQMPQEEAFGFIVEMLDVNLAVALDLANKVMTKRPLLHRLFEKGLSSANASSIRFWLESLLPRLGLRETVRLLRQHLDTDPQAVGQALYFLPALATTATDAKLVRDLRHDADAKLAIRQ